MANRRISVNLSRTVNLGEFESVKAGVNIETDISDKADMAEEFDSLWELAEGQVDNYLTQYEGDEEPSEEVLEEELPEEVPEEELLEEVPEEELLEEELTEEDINIMTKAELVDLCKTTEGLEDVDTSLNLKPLRAVLIDLLFTEEELEEGEEGTEEGEEGTEEGEEGEEWQDDQWQDE